MAVCTTDPITPGTFNASAIELLAAVCTPPGDQTLRSGIPFGEGLPIGHRYNAGTGADTFIESERGQPPVTIRTE